MLRQLLISMALVCACVGNAFAQGAFAPKKHDHQGEHKHEGRFFVGGAINYWYDTEDKSQSLSFAPEVGYLFNDTWGVGTYIGLGHQSVSAQSSIATAGVRINTLSLTPFVRYYYFHRLPFNLYLDGCVGWNMSRTSVNSNLLGITGKLEPKVSHGFEVGIRPGACVDLTEGLCLCLRLGFLGYRNDFFAGEEEGIGENGFGIRFAPEELKIGLELEF